MQSNWGPHTILSNYFFNRTPLRYEGVHAFISAITSDSIELLFNGVGGKVNLPISWNTVEILQPALQSLSQPQAEHENMLLAPADWEGTT